MSKRLIVFLGLFLMTATIAQAKTTGEIPEVSGVYDDPGHPGIKVRVFVHQGKPQPAPSPVCSLADPDSNAVVEPLAWQLPNNWSYNLNLDSAPAAFRASLPTIAGRAFGVWQAAINNQVNFVLGDSTAVNRQAYDLKNIIAWGRTNGSALAVTYTRYASSTGQVVDVDTIMNQKFAWSWTDQNTNALCSWTNTYDAQNILTHELGHWLGLNDEYTDAFADNTMFGYGSQAEVKKDTLTTGDIQGALAIY